MVKTLPSNTGGAGLIPGLGAKIPHALWPENQNIKKQKQCNKFNKDFKNGPHTHTHTIGLRKKRMRIGQPAVGFSILCSNMGLPQWLSR